MGWNERLNRRLCQGMRYVPTKQNPHPQKTHTLVLNNNRRKHPSVSTGRHGSNYWPTETQWKGCDPHHRRSRMLKSGHIPPMYDQNNRPWYRPTVHGPRVSMVWTPDKNHQRQRPVIHLTLRKSPCRETGDPPKPVHCIPPTNQQDI